MSERSEEASGWYIVKQPEGHCNIVSRTSSTEAQQAASEEQPAELQLWGPFESQSEAIARRVGLIRAGKCLPQ